MQSVGAQPVCVVMRLVSGAVCCVSLGISQSNPVELPLDVPEQVGSMKILLWIGLGSDSYRHGHRTSGGVGGSCDVEHQGVGGRSFESCGLRGGTSMDWTCSCTTLDAHSVWDLRPDRSFEPFVMFLRPFPRSAGSVVAMGGGVLGLCNGVWVVGACKVTSSWIPVPKVFEEKFAL